MWQFNSCNLGSFFMCEQQSTPSVSLWFVGLVCSPSHWTCCPTQFHCFTVQLAAELQSCRAALTGSVLSSDCHFTCFTAFIVTGHRRKQQLTNSNVIYWWRLKILTHIIADINMNSYWTHAQRFISSTRPHSFYFVSERVWKQRRLTLFRYSDGCSLVSWILVCGCVFFWSIDWSEAFLLFHFVSLHFLSSKQPPILLMWRNWTKLQHTDTDNTDNLVVILGRALMDQGQVCDLWPLEGVGEQGDQ